jgi:hypothetical protein
MEWFFRQQKPGEITRDPIIGEFFSTDAIDNPAEALVREGIQNALDAKLDDEINIRILLVTGNHATETNRVSRWFDGAWDHFHALGNGLNEPPYESEYCPFLVFEDFGTTGLQGDVLQPFDEPGNQNSFFYFFRAEGRSGKSEADRGRWGIGKHVFPRSSRISTYFGLTVRADDDQHLLMGHTILKSHRMGVENYTPDGYLGEPSKDSIFMLPITETNTLAHFCKDFNILRDSQLGLSVVVPFVDPEITIQHLKKAVISGYFYPILKSELTVDIETPDSKVRIDSKSILDETSLLEEKARENMVPLIDLADWVAFRSIGKEYVINPCILECPVWSDDLIPEEMIGRMRNDLDSGRKLAVYVGIKVREKGKTPVLSYFYVYLCRDGFESGRPIFIREGIIIPDIHSPRTRGVRSLVIVSDKPLATLLGDSENPAHTQWQKNSSNFTNKYDYGKNYIEFVTKIVSNLVNTLGTQEEQEDPNLLLDIFSLPLEKLEDHPKSPTDGVQPTSGDISGLGPIPVEPKEKRFRISRVKGGFRIGPSDSVIKPPVRLDIQVAYDMRKGNPLTKYHPSDFMLEREPIRYCDSIKGVSVVNVENNHMLVDVLDPDFQLSAAGFDEKRDLFVKVYVVDEAQND